MALVAADPSVFLRKAAVKAVPAYAVVQESAFESLAAALDSNKNGLQVALDEGYREMDRRQPVLGAWLSEVVADRTDETAQSLGYFLAVTIYLVFREAFPTRLGEVDLESLQSAVDMLEADEELRANDPTEVLDTDDVIAMGQPAVIEFVQHHLKEAVHQADEEVDLEDLDRIYRAVLVEVLALTEKVNPPQGDTEQVGNALN